MGEQERFITTRRFRCELCGHTEKRRFFGWGKTLLVYECPKCHGIMDRLPASPANHYHPTRRKA